MSYPKNMKIGLAIVAVAIVIAASTLFSLRLIAPPATPQLEGRVDVRIIKGDTIINLNFSDLLSMPSVTRLSSFQNRFQNWRGNGIYVGVTLATLITLAGGMDENDLVRVNATDGYYQYFAHYNLYPNASFTALQGDLVLAYSYNDTTPGTSLTSWGDGPRIAFLPPDSAYSNADANQTTYPGFFSSAGARWVSNVVTIEVIPDVYIGGSLHVSVIDGTYLRNVYLVNLALMKNFEGVSAYQKQTGTWGGNGTYNGVALSAIVELMGPFDSNDVVIVSASDWEQSFAYYNLYPNTSISNLQGVLILAYIFNGTVAPSWGDGPRIAFLPPDEAYSNSDASLTTHPAWFIGSAGARWVHNVIQIEIQRDSFPP